MWYNVKNLKKQDPYFEAPSAYLENEGIVIESRIYIKRTNTMIK